MKKIYAILVAACMSVSLFAAQPTQSDLQGFMEEGFYVACFQAPEGATCNDIFWMGEYCGWNIGTDLTDLVKCEPLDGFVGWYVAKVPVANGDDGKPIQLNECGKLTWDVQPGPAAPSALVAGSVDIVANGDEYDFKNWSTTEPTIITIGSWKKGYNPCDMTCLQKSYTLRVYPPYCEYNDELRPIIRGNFNNWGDPIPMTLKGAYYEYETGPITDAQFDFKFINSENKDNWSHQFEMYDAENDGWTNIPATGNINLTNVEQFATKTGNIYTFVFDKETEEGDPLFRYANCTEPTEPEHYAVHLKAPAGGPAEVEIVGSFGEDTWNNGIAMELVAGVWSVELDADPLSEFKFRKLGTWDDEIQVWNGEGWDGLPNMQFGAEAEDGVIDLDFTDPEFYKWKSTPEGIENVVLTEKAQKVVVDGVLYIIRDNKMFNVQGAQVR